MSQPLYFLEEDLVPIVQKMGGPQGQSGQERKNSSPQDLIPGPSMPTMIHQPSLAYLLVILKITKSFLKIYISFFGVEVCNFTIKVSADVLCVGAMTHSAGTRSIIDTEYG
jgi:hypothetical protein